MSQGTKKIDETKINLTTSIYLKREEVGEKNGKKPKNEMKKTTPQKRKSLKNLPPKSKKIRLLPLNPMLFYFGYPHITEKIC